MVADQSEFQISKFGASVKDALTGVPRIDGEQLFSYRLICDHCPVGK